MMHKRQTDLDAVTQDSTITLLYCARFLHAAQLICTSVLLTPRLSEATVS